MKFQIYQIPNYNNKLANNIVFESDDINVIAKELEKNHIMNYYIMKIK